MNIYLKIAHHVPQFVDIHTQKEKDKKIKKIIFTFLIRKINNWGEKMTSQQSRKSFRFLCLKKMQCAKSSENPH